MSRLPNWDIALIQAVEFHAQRPFSWGGLATGAGSDCFEMTMDAVKAVTGTDPYEDERGRYRTRIGALRRFTKRGFAWLDGAYSDAFPPVPVLMARRGDIGLVSLDGEDCSVVVMGAQAVGKSPSGIVRVPVNALRKAFKVG
ncbi:hypothetical protein [Roseibium sp. RKSG952]|uniref:DUF6950 family protein n=1 Tax=Roseibium sp. RKSG952 TaxID=2529384 RepID=UPI0012BC79F6|nr:hypothetical protein [Roseibium sp. RKSG952]MTH96429.1 hypothetical protein [Roseibium sp. RKSG952]